MRSLQEPRLRVAAQGPQALLHVAGLPVQEVQPDCRATARDGRTGEYGFPGTGGCPLSVLPTKSRGPTDGLRRAAASRLLGAEGDDGESGTILTQENWDFLFESRGFRVFPGMIPIRAAHTLSCPPELNGGSVNSTQGSQHPDSNLSGEFRGSSCTWAPRSPRSALRRSRVARFHGSRNRALQLGVGVCAPRSRHWRLLHWEGCFKL